MIKYFIILLITILADRASYPTSGKNLVPLLPTNHENKSKGDIAMLTELWKPIKGYEGLYEISNFGRVKSLKRNILRMGEKRTIKIKEKILIPIPIRNYMVMHLSKNGKAKHFYIHRIVAIHYIPNPHNKSQINHLDCNPRNNSVNNLEWCTPIENIHHAIRKGKKSSQKGVNNIHNKLTVKEVKEIRELKGKLKQKDIAIRYKISKPVISSILNKRSWKHI